MQLTTLSSALQQAANLPRSRYEVQNHYSDTLVTLSQSASPTLEQNASPARTSAPVASPASASQPGSQQPTPPSATKKRAPASSAHKKRTPRKPHPKPQKVVIRNGSTTDPSEQFSTTASPEQATHERQNTASLLATTQANLQKLSGRQLSSSQQDTLTEIRGYMQQAKAAEDSGDLQSAQNLALKAQLLSSELIRK
ncbi:MAG: hypothetical protein ACRD2S_00650 [Terriglobales bacterium]